jgi:hypothetical protein
MECRNDRVNDREGDAVDELEPWEQREGESAPAFHAFTIYRGLGPRRSLVKVQEVLDEERAARKRRHNRGKEQAPNKPQSSSKKRQPNGNLKLWSRGYDWVVRAQAWDREQDRIRRAAIAEENEKAARRHINAMMLLQKIASDHLTKVKPEDLDPLTAKKFLLDGIKGERAFRGLDAPASNGKGDKGDDEPQDTSPEAALPRLQAMLLKGLKRTEAREQEAAEGPVPLALQQQAEAEAAQAGEPEGSPLAEPPGG